MKFKTLKYFSTVLVFAVALCAGWWMWNYYMQSPWTRDGKVRAELVDITPEVSGRIIGINVHDNQLVKSGDLLFTLDPQPFKIALDNAQAALAKAAADLDKANHEAQRRRGLGAGIVSAETLDESNIAAKAMKAQYEAAQASLEQAQWNLSKTKIFAPTDGYITNLQTRRGNYATTGTPLVGLVDT
ncbi:MAG: HlyD family secretion protein, partial [Ewingella sp.]|nr:HlyD family secretion protein [Ewingella sp.]